MNFKGSSSFLAARSTISSGHRIPSEWPSIASVPSRGNLDDPRSEGGMKGYDWPDETESDLARWPQPVVYHLYFSG